MSSLANVLSTYQLSSTSYSHFIFVIKTNIPHFRACIFWMVNRGWYVVYMRYSCAAYLMFSKQLQWWQMYVCVSERKYTQHKNAPTYRLEFQYVYVGQYSSICVCNGIYKWIIACVFKWKRVWLNLWIADIAAGYLRISVIHVLLMSSDARILIISCDLCRICVKFIRRMNVFSMTDGLRYILELLIIKYFKCI